MFLLWGEKTQKANYFKYLDEQGLMGTPHSHNLGAASRVRVSLSEALRDHMLVLHLVEPKIPRYL